MLATQMPSRPEACLPDAWTLEMGRRIPHLSPAQAALAARAVLEALVDNLPQEDAIALAAGMNPGMRSGLEEILPTRGSAPAVQGDSLVMSVAARLPRFFPHHACLLTRIVLEIITECSAHSAVARVQAATPARWRKLWPKPSLHSVAEA